MPVTHEKDIDMYLRVMGTQNGNSCAAHCMEIAEACVNKGIPRSQSMVEGASVWDQIVFLPNPALGPDYARLVAAKNTDPRRLLRYARGRKGCANAELLADTVQRDIALKKLPGPMQAGAKTLFSLLTASAKHAAIRIQKGVFYNCSYAMFDAKLPVAAKFSGYHNMLVILDGSELKFYNPNEASPSWKTVPKGIWKELVNQNSGAASYVFTGIAVTVP
jgi:hypothetical protein